MLVSQFVPPSPSTAVSTSLFSTSASPFLPLVPFFSRFHIYVLICNICFSLPNLLHFV